MVRVQSSGDRTKPVLRVSDVDTTAVLDLPPCAFVLTLECDPDVSYARGQLRLLADDVTYPIQSNAALFERLSQILAPRANR